ncbi:PP2C family protein-serine/threonine phosphatase [Microbacterium invictum]|uniref:Protein phosphatase n=1 Tax=Microbacterium invictum TaxID=515415 RepID=A0AA40VM62_9MICO|nr:MULTISPECIES: protein phosphatase 2C domain-containing protein [Microbacterium]MBB4139354.1 protein phosphatase [Microbacterium invictum]
MTLRLQAGVCSDVGTFRENNQDAAFAAPWAAGVADGVGGGPAGDLASAALVHGLISGGRRCEDAVELATRVRMANWDLGAHVRRDPTLQGMATTFTGLWFTPEGVLLLAHTGDSRAYLARDGRLTRETRDDSFVQALVDQGLVRAEDAASHPRRNMITASLRGEETDLVRVDEREARVGDRWMLCSDGISDYLPDEDIKALVTGIQDPSAAARRLVELALEAGSRDNVTAVVCDLTDGPEPSHAVPLVAGSATERFPEVFEEGLAATA